MVGGVGGKFDGASIMKNMQTLAGGASASVKTTQEGQQQIKKAGENLSQKLFKWRHTHGKFHIGFWSMSHIYSFF